MVHISYFRVCVKSYKKFERVDQNSEDTLKLELKRLLLSFLDVVKYNPLDFLITVNT
jgi:hypothetical protein